MNLRANPACIVCDVAVAVAILMPCQAGANLLVNGGFELGTDPASYTTLVTGNTSITGWTVSEGELDYVGFLWTPAECTRSLDMNASASATPGGISQAFSTTPGQVYSVDFDLAGNPDGLPVIKTLQAEAAGQTGNFTFDTTGLNPFFMGWTTKNWSFTANSSTTTLTFRSLDTLTSFGPALDNVVVTAVPEPNSLFALSPLLFLTLKRRRR